MPRLFPGGNRPTPTHLLLNLCFCLPAGRQAFWAGQLKNRRATGNAVILTFTAPQDLTGYMINKGSVAVDGISLTINQCHATGFEVSIIPHTAQITTIGLKETGESVNIETDIIGKYVQRFLKQDEAEPAPAPGNGVDLELLAKSGYLK